MSNYTSQDTSVNHYKFLLFVWRKPASCGDAYTTRYYYFYRSSPVVFYDNSLSFTIALTNTTNGYPSSSEPCNSVNSDLNAYIPSVQGSIEAGPVAPETSKVRADLNPFYGIYSVKKIDQNTDVSFSQSTNFTDVDICYLSPKGWTSQNMPYYEYEFSLIRDRVKITDVTAPLNNWKLQRQMNSQGI